MEEHKGSVAIDHARMQVERLDSVRRRIASLKDEEKELIAQVRAAIGIHQVGTVDGIEAVRLDSRTTTHLDRDTVKDLLGAEAYGTALRHTPYIAVKVLPGFRRGV